MIDSRSKGNELSIYLTGRTVIFELPPLRAPTTTINEQGHERTGVCVRHRNGWTTIRTKRDTYSVREEKVLAYVPRGGR
jgi:hypothetical protein